jgi:hypothetical protein
LRRAPCSTRAAELGSGRRSAKSETAISACVGYSGYDVNVTTASVELAVKIAELVRRHYEEA